MTEPSSDDDPVLPEQTRDDVDPEGVESEDDDDRFLRERPPHWD